MFFVEVIFIAPTILYISFIKSNTEQFNQLLFNKNQPSNKLYNHEKEYSIKPTLTNKQ